MSRGRKAPFPLLRRSLALAYAALVFVFGMIDPGPHPPGLASDKLEHFLAFGGFAWVVELALLELGTVSRRVLAVLVSAATGLALELVQSALPHRSAEALDFAADAAGAVGAVLLSTLVAQLFRSRGKAEPRRT